MDDGMDDRTNGWMEKASRPRRSLLYVMFLCSHEKESELHASRFPYLWVLIRFRNTLRWPFLSFGEPTCLWTSSPTQCNVGVTAALCSVSFTGEFLPNFNLKKIWFQPIKKDFSWEIFLPKFTKFRILKEFLIARVLW
jgi:hypothetical protein